MGKVASYYYVTESGRAPAREFIDSLDFTTQRKFFFVKDLLEEFGHTLPFPHAKYIGNNIFELRFGGQEGGVRVLYFFYHQDKVIFTNGFIKKSGKIPRHEIKIAVGRMNKYANKSRGGYKK